MAKIRLVEAAIARRAASELMESAVVTFPCVDDDVPMVQGRLGFLTKVRGL